MHLPLLLEFEVVEEEEMFALTCIEITPVTQNIEQHWAKIAIYLGFKSKDLVFHLQLFFLLRQNCWVLHLPTDKSFESEANWLEILYYHTHFTCCITHSASDGNLVEVGLINTHHTKVYSEAKSPKFTGKGTGQVNISIFFFPARSKNRFSFQVYTLFIYMMPLVLSFKFLGHYNSFNHLG